MKFKAVLVDRGLQLLEKGFLPTIEKFGKKCHLLLGPEEVCFVQTPLLTDGPVVVARFKVSVLFDPDAYKCLSKHYNLMAFLVDIALLLRALRSVGTGSSGGSGGGAQSVEVKLSQRPQNKSAAVATEAAAEDAAPGTPFLTFTVLGQVMSVVQDVPISKPYSSAEINQLAADKDMSVMCPYYVDLHTSLPRLQGMVDKMKSVADVLLFATCKNGDVHLQTAATNMLLGTQLRQLSVYPTHTQPETAADRSVPAEDQLHAALQSGDATGVHLQLKHLLRMFHVADLTMPSQFLCGIAPDAAYVQIMFVYRDDSSGTRIDDSINLAVRLPVRDETS